MGTEPHLAHSPEAVNDSNGGRAPSMCEDRGVKENHAGTPGALEHDARNVKGKPTPWVSTRLWEFHVSVAHASHFPRHPPNPVSAAS